MLQCKADWARWVPVREVRCGLLPLLSSVLCLTVLAAAQQPKVAPVEPPPPPPPPIKKEEKLATPQRIRVGRHVQANYQGPAPQWFSQGPALADAQIGALQQALVTNPENVCARARLIAFGREYVGDLTDHVLWMVQHHPEWDGFLVFFSERNRHEDTEASWRRHIGTQQQDARVLHHAAVFFQYREPALAEELMERAIRMGTDTPLHFEGLGRLYARATRRSENASFAQLARSKLLAASNPYLFAGAMNEIDGFNPKARMGGALGDSLRARLLELGISKLPPLPSRSPEYNRLKCDFIPLLRRFEEP